MYAVLCYNNYEQVIEVKKVTYHLDYAKKVAFQCAKNDIPKNNSMYKITNNITKKYSNTIIDFAVIEVNKQIGGKYNHKTTLPNIYSVIKFQNQINGSLPEIDMTMICNDYVSYSEDWFLSI